MKINDRQWIELINRPNAGEGQLDHIALYSDSADRMRAYLAARGVKVPARTETDRTGNTSFVVVDPDGERRRAPLHDHSKRIADEDRIDPRRVENARPQVVIGSQHGQLPPPRLGRDETGNGDRAGRGGTAG